MDHTTFLQSTSLLFSAAIFVIMIVVGMSHDVRGYTLIASRPRPLFIGLLFQLFFLPTMALAVAQFFGLSQVFCLGLLLMALSPCGACSGIIALSMKANVALSVVLTVSTSLLIPVTLPIGVVVFIGREFALPLVDIATQLLLLVTLPVVCGVLIRYRYTVAVANVLPVLKKVSFALLLIILVGTISKKASIVIESLPVLIAPCFILSGLAFIVPRYFAQKLGVKREDAVTIGVQVGMQNGTTALAVIVLNPELATSVIPVALYTLTAFFIAFALIPFWRTSDPAPSFGVA